MLADTQALGGYKCSEGCKCCVGHTCLGGGMLGGYLILLFQHCAAFTGIM